jgi:RNA polymerase sigma-70 factor (ECF subfamily)
VQETSKADVRSESALVKEAFRGNSAAFGRIVSRYQEPVFNLCGRYLLAADAEDAAQETFIRAFVHREKFDPARPVLPWLFTIARRLCIDRLRARKVGPTAKSEEVVVADSAAPVDDVLGAREELAIVAKAVEALPEGQREAIIQHHVEGLTYREVADVLCVPIGTVMTWLHRGRAKLQAHLKALSRDPVSRRQLEENHERIG